MASPRDLPNGRPATPRGLAGIKAAFAQSAAVVREIGADGVEVGHEVRPFVRAGPEWLT